MRKLEQVHGSEASAKPLIVGKDTVYIHTNIEKVKRIDEGGNTYDEFVYDEVQYDKDEYIKLMSEKNEELEQALTDTQLALIELYEMKGDVQNG